MRKGLIAIIVIVLAVVGYVAGVITTKKATYQAVEVMVEEIERAGQMNVSVEWEEQGSRNATVVFKVEMAEIADMPDFDFPISYEETVELSYGFLNTKWEGSGDVLFDGKKLSEVIYDGQKITSTGVVSHGGMQIAYNFPNIDMLEEGFAVQAEPMQMNVVIAGEERRFDFVMPEVTLQGESNESMLLKSLMFKSDTRMLDGELFSSDTLMSLESMELNVEAIGAPIVVTGISSTANSLRVDEEMRVNGLFVLGSLDAGPAVKGNARIDWAVEGVNYNEFVMLNETLQNQDLSEEEILERVFTTLFANEDMLFRLNELLISGEGWGNLRSHGTLRLDIANLSDSEKAKLIDNPELFRHYAVDIVVEEMPGMLQMAMMAFTSEELPWNVNYKDGELYINNELIDLSAMQ